MNWILINCRKGDAGERPCIVVEFAGLDRIDHRYSLVDDIIHDVKSALQDAEHLFPNRRFLPIMPVSDDSSDVRLIVTNDGFNYLRFIFRPIVAKPMFDRTGIKAVPSSTSDDPFLDKGDDMKPERMRFSVGNVDAWVPNDTLKSVETRLPQKTDNVAKIDKVLHGKLVKCIADAKKYQPKWMAEFITCLPHEDSSMGGRVYYVHDDMYAMLTAKKTDGQTEFETQAWGSIHEVVGNELD